MKDERGMSRLEWLGAISLVVGILVFVPALRDAVADIYDRLIWGNTFWRGVWVSIVAVVAFMGSIYLILYTNMGTRLGFLVAGSALTGWGVIQGLLFTLTVPRGPRPATFEGLNAFQIRIMSLALMLGSLVLFAMFLTALNRLESGDDQGQD